MNNHLITHTICLSGAIIFLWLKLPLPWLFGPLVSCLLAALIGSNLYSIMILSDAYKQIFKTENLNQNLNKLNGQFKENNLVKEVVEFINKDKKRPICTPLPR